MTPIGPAGAAVPNRLSRWLDRNVGPEGPWRLRALTGGNSNDTGLLTGADGSYVLRRPPRATLSATAHAVAREHRLLTALHPTAVPVPRPVAVCEDPAVDGGPFLVMEHVPDAVSVTDAEPDGWATHPRALRTAADQLVDALVAVHRLDWAAAGLDGFGRPDGFLERQPRRWLEHWRTIACRPLPALDRLARWLTDAMPSERPVGLLHGDFHLDNSLFAAHRPELLALIDWEMATIGDPLLDLGLLLAFWGERGVDEPGLPHVQAVSRAPDAPPREHLLDRYAAGIGRAVPQARYYQVLALYKLAAIIESSYAQHRAGRLDTPYAASLGTGVPALLDEALATAGIAAGTVR
jgi:aminoglycoside phosphotransferase (APT) family kinase protein